MDYTEEVQWRGRVLLRKGALAGRTEFFVHAGKPLLIDYTPCDIRGGARIDQADVVPAHFAATASRFEQTLDRYYCELASPGDWAHMSNVLAGIGMASSASRFVRRWVTNCTAPEAMAISMANAIFDAVKVHYGSVATSRVRLEQVELDRANAEMARAMTNAARAINAECNRIVA